MPTAYTSRLYYGEQSLEDFVLTVSKAFFIHMKETPVDAPLQKIRENPYDSEVEKRSQELDRLYRLEDNDAWWKAVWQQAENYKIEEYNRHKEIVEKRRVRYEKMREQLSAWDPPAELIRMKEYALEQIDDSAKFDLSTGPEPTPLSLEDFKRDQWVSALSALQRAITRRAQHQKTMERVNQKIDLILESLNQ